MSTPLISILVPAYQAEGTICRCLSSIDKQTLGDYEVIVIDDGSLDGTFQLACSFCTNPRFKVFTQTNKGVSATRKKLLDLARGRYIQFIDADDWVEPKMIENYCTILSHEQPDVIITDFILHSSKGTSYQSQEPTSMESSKLIKDISSTKLMGVLWNKLIRKDLLDAIDFPNLKYCEDWCICLSLFRLTSNILYNRYAFYNHDINNVENSLVRNINKTTFQSRIEYIQHLKRLNFDNEFSNEYNTVVSGIAYTAIVNNIYSDKEFSILFKDVSFWNNYNILYKRFILVLSYSVKLSFLQKIDSVIRKIMK